MQINAVAYIGIKAADPGAWLTYCVDVLGMMRARAVPGQGWGAPGQLRPASAMTGVAPDGSVYLKMDDRQWRVAVHPSDGENGLAYLGFEVDGPLAFEAGLAELRAAGVEARVGSPAEAGARAVSGIAFFEDPAGHAIELIWGQTCDYNFQSAIPDHRFVAGHLGVGHFNLFVRNQAACFDFYTGLLGFRLTDYFSYGGDARLQFLRCNPRHHSIAMIELGQARGLQHMLVELQNIDAVGRTLDRALKAGVEVVSSLGRHRNDGMLSFYMDSPGGFHVEVGCWGLLIGDDWRPNQFCEGDVWGHHGLIEAVQKAAMGGTGGVA